MVCVSAHVCACDVIHVQFLNLPATATHRNLAQWCSPADQRMPCLGNALRERGGEGEREREREREREDEWEGETERGYREGY